MTNILTALRSSIRDMPKKCTWTGDGLTKKELATASLATIGKAARCLDDTPYAAFAKKCFDAKEAECL